MSKETMSSFAGKRALITGASSGLGLEFADLLAGRHFIDTQVRIRRASHRRSYGTAYCQFLSGDSPQRSSLS
jgi:NAD(P)-dependent dehydrogenase (short-subunit alcohol dehydrogenase family)